MSKAADRSKYKLSRKIIHIFAMYMLLNFFNRHQWKKLFFCQQNAVVTGDTWPMLNLDPFIHPYAAIEQHLCWLMQEFVLSVTEKNLNLRQDQYRLLMLLPINSPCNLWAIVSVEEADVEDLKGVEFMLFFFLIDAGQEQSEGIDNTFG